MNPSPPPSSWCGGLGFFVIGIRLSHAAKPCTPVTFPEARDNDTSFGSFRSCMDEGGIAQRYADMVDIAAPCKKEDIAWLHCFCLVAPGCIVLAFSREWSQFRHGRDENITEEARTVNSRPRKAPCPVGRSQPRQGHRDEVYTIDCFKIRRDCAFVGNTIGELVIADSPDWRKNLFDIVDDNRTIVHHFLGRKSRHASKAEGGKQ